MKKRLLIILSVAALLIAGTVAVASAVSMDNAADAEATALAHAGVTEAQWIHSEYDVDDGVPQWEVDFYADGWEYEYTIHAETGQIIAYDKEYDGPKPTTPTTPAAPPTSPLPPAQTPTSPAGVTLTAQEAEQLALAHAGLSAEQVTRLHSEYDVDDGIPQYEIEFHHGDWEYEYEVHAETGEILRSEMDRDD